MHIIIEKDIRKLEYSIRIAKEDVDRAFTSQYEYNHLIAGISKAIYDYKLKH